MEASPFQRRKGVTNMKAQNLGKITFSGSRSQRFCTTMQFQIARHKGIQICKYIDIAISIIRAC